MKTLRAADKWFSSSSVVGRRPNNSSPCQQAYYEKLYRASDMEVFFEATHVREMETILYTVALAVDQ